MVFMLKTPTARQTELEMVTLESLVPADHLLRRIDAVIDFTFIRERVAGLYCPGNNRLALNPVVMFKALLSATCSASARSASRCARSR